MAAANREFRDCKNVAQTISPICDDQCKSVSIKTGNKWVNVKLYIKHKVVVAPVWTRGLPQWSNKDALRGRCLGRVSHSSIFWSLYKRSNPVNSELFPIRAIWFHFICKWEPHLKTHSKSAITRHFCKEYENLLFSFWQLAEQHLE